MKPRVHSLLSAAALLAAFSEQKPILPPQARTPEPLTPEDIERIEAARTKRLRRAERRTNGGGK